mgnify:CR=1 FL=1
MKYTYKTQGTCSSHIELEIEDNIIRILHFGEVVTVICKVFPFGKGNAGK